MLLVKLLFNSTPKRGMQSVLVSALEQENRTLIDKIIKLEAKIQQNDNLYISSHASAALMSHAKNFQDQTKIQALKQSIHQMETDIARITAEKVGIQTKCANLEKAFQLSEAAKNALMLENTKLRSIITQYKTNEELLVRAVTDYIDTFSDKSYAHFEEGRLISALPPCEDGKFDEPRLDTLNKSLYTLLTILKARSNSQLISEQDTNIQQTFYSENKRLTAEIITLRAQLETEKTERKSLLQEAKDSFTQLKSLQASQLEIRNKKISDLEDRISLLESALKRKQSEINDLLAHIETAPLGFVELEAIQAKQQEEIRTDQRESFSNYAGSIIDELASEVHRETSLELGNPSHGLRRVSFDSKILYSNPISPAFGSVASISKKAPAPRQQRDEDIMRMASGKRLSIADAANTIRDLTE